MVDAAGLVQRPTNYDMIDVTKTHRDHMALTLAVLTILVASFLRLWKLQSVPFGWHPDEATKALLARDVLAGKFLPAFFSAFTGREALYVYLEAGSFVLLGERIFSARLLSAVIGVLTVALTYLMGKTLFNRRIGLFAAIFLAASLWHLIASRNGYRAVIQPLVQLPVIILFFRGLRTEGRASFGAFTFAGFWLGLTQYTYTAARFFPLLMLLIVAFVALYQPRTVWSRRKGLFSMLLVSLIVFVPLGMHFLQNPIDFYGRAAQVSVLSPEWSGGDPLARLWQSIKETVRMFTVWGDINYRFNIAGQPVFGAAVGALFYGGLLLSLWRAAKSNGLQRLAYVTLLLWTAIMLLPMTLSAESLPYYQRAIGIVPAVFVLPAVTLDAVVTGMARFSQPTVPARRGAVAVSAVALLILLGAGTYDDYFKDWHLARRNDDDRRVAMVYVADYLRQNGAPQNLYVSSQYAQHPTLALLDAQHYDQVEWFDASQSLPLPAAAEQAMYLLLLENEPEELLLQAAPGLERTHVGRDRFERPVFEVYSRTADEWPAAEVTEPATWSWEVTFDENAAPEMRHQIELPVSFDDVAAFRGYNQQPEKVVRGGSLELVLFWQLLQRPKRQYTFFVHLLDANSNVISGYDANTYATANWKEEGGELLLNYFPLTVSDEIAPGTYQLEIGVYHQPSGERLPVLEEGQVVADRLLLEPVVIE